MEVTRKGVHILSLEPKTNETTATAKPVAMEGNGIPAEESGAGTGAGDS